MEDDEDGAIWGDAGASDPSPIGEILDRGKGNFTLLELLCEDEIVQEVKGMNQELLEFLCEDATANTLVGYICEGVDAKESEQSRLRAPYAACEVVCCEIKTLLDAVVPHIPRLFRAAAGKGLREGMERPSPRCASYISRVLDMFRRVRPVALADGISRCGWSGEGDGGGEGGESEDGGVCVGIGARLDDDGAIAVLEVVLRSIVFVDDPRSLAGPLVEALCGALEGKWTVPKFPDDADGVSSSLARDLARSNVWRLVQEVIVPLGEAVPSPSILKPSSSSSSSSTSDGGDLGGLLQSHTSLGRALARDESLLTPTPLSSLPTIVLAHFRHSTLLPSVTSRTSTGPAWATLALLTTHCARLVGGLPSPTRTTRESKPPCAAIPVPPFLDAALSAALPAALEVIGEATERGKKEVRLAPRTRRPIAPPLGLIPLHAAAFIAGLFRCPWEEVQGELQGSQAAKALMNLMLAYPWHSQLHIAIATPLQDAASRAQSPWKPDPETMDLLFHMLDETKGPDPPTGLAAPATTIALQLVKQNPKKHPKITTLLRNVVKKEAIRIGGHVPEASSLKDGPIAGSVDEVDQK